ncbi:MAG: nickel transporter permease [Anaerolineae bacterium]
MNACSISVKTVARPVDVRHGSLTDGGRARLASPLRLWRNRTAMAGLTIVSAICLVALLAPVAAPHDPNEQYSERLAPSSAQFPLGTDSLGRDLLSRLLYGARISVGVSFLAAVLIVLLGVSLGTWAGYVGGLVDEIIMRLVDILLAFPGLLLALAIVGILGPGLVNVMVAVASVWWADYARLTRSIALEVRSQPYIEAAEAVGASPLRIAIHHIVPNIIPPVIVLASQEMGGLILAMAGLSFLGLGAQPPEAEWGSMLNQGRAFFQVVPQLMLYPGSMISLTVLGFNLLGDGLRDVLDPRRR